MLDETSRFVGDSAPALRPSLVASLLPTTSPPLLPLLPLPPLPRAIALISGLLASENGNGIGARAMADRAASTVCARRCVRCIDVDQSPPSPLAQKKTATT